MNKLTTGQFYGKHQQKSALENIIITDTEYTHPKVDWHYHENPYFTYIIQGHVHEINKKEAYVLEPGSLIFHNWQDPHYNVKSSRYTRGFHIELNENWFSNYAIKTRHFQGSINLKNPLVKSLMNKIFAEFKHHDTYTPLSIDSLLINVFDTLAKTDNKPAKKPAWVNQLRALVLEEEVDYSLTNLSTILNIHPVHLSREFKRYFGASLGHYIRLLKLNKAFYLIAENKQSMTEICYRCGFYDQSHFIASFKRVYGTTPLQFSKKIR